MTFKASACSGCPLADTPSRFIPAIGPTNAAIAIIGEAGGREEGLKGEPFIGPAGNLLSQGLRLVYLEREATRIHNILSCRPNNDWLVNAPYEHQAINHCRVHREPILAEPHRVFLAVGATAARVLLNQPKKGFVLEEWHSTATQFGVLPSGEPRWIVPSFHPAHLLRGAYNLMGAWLHALKLVKEISENGWEPDPISTIIDPGLDVYRAWARQILAMPESWLVVDIETPEKLSGVAEDALDDPTYEIIRSNFAYHPDEGLTVPKGDPWDEVTRELLAGPNPKVLWNAPFDCPRIRAQGWKIGGRILDFMDAWHMLQSDVPRGLGFVAPFYSRHGAWKHLSGSNPGLYAALDGPQTLRCALGITRDLQAEGRWDSYWRDMYTLDTRVLRPGERAGVLIDIPALEKFSGELTELDNTMIAEMQELVPQDALPLVSGSPDNPSYTGWKRIPKDREGVVERVTLDKKTGASVTRYYVRGKFNPDSRKHILLYLDHMKLKPGKGKRGKGADGGDSVDALALDSLGKKDKVCALILKRRKITKVNSTYCLPTLVRVKAPGSDGRLHTTFTHIPSTMRLASAAPNLQNVVTR